MYSLDKCTAATSTEELMSYSCVEVQTTPYDTPESESESNDEPIENLSVSNTIIISMSIIFIIFMFFIIYITAVNKRAFESYRITGENC